MQVDEVVWAWSAGSVALTNGSYSDGAQGGSVSRRPSTSAVTAYGPGLSEAVRELLFSKLEFVQLDLA